MRLYAWRTPRGHGLVAEKEKWDRYHGANKLQTVDMMSIDAALIIATETDGLGSGRDLVRFVNYSACSRG